MLQEKLSCKEIVGENFRYISSILMKKENADELSETKFLREIIYTDSIPLKALIITLYLKHFTTIDHFHETEVHHGKKGYLLASTTQLLDWIQVFHTLTEKDNGKLYILAGDYLITQFYMKIAEIKSPAIFRIMNDALLQVFENCFYNECSTGSIIFSSCFNAINSLVPNEKIHHLNLRKVFAEYISILGNEL